MAITTIIEIFASILCAVISGLILAKFQQSQKADAVKHAHNVEAAVKDRELIMAIATTTELLTRKIEGEKINGELKRSTENLAKKKDAVSKFTTVSYFKSIER